MLELSRPAARALALAAQGLAAPPATPATPADIRAAIRRMGLLQIDSIHVVARSPYFVLWSRLGAYDPAWLDTLLAEGAIFEYWAHAACFLPIEDYPLYRRIMLSGQDGGKTTMTVDERRRAWIAAHQDEVDLILARIRSGGAVRAADFPRTDGQRGTWWDWKPEKQVLERLFYLGVLMVARRENFQRVYDLRERVLPDWDDARVPPAEEVRRAFALKAVRALGVARADWVATYFYTARRGTAELLESLAEEGRIERVRVAGWNQATYVHPDHRAAAEAAAAWHARAGAHDAAVAVRPARVGPGTRGGAVRLHLSDRGLHAGRAAPLRLLHPAHPARRRPRRPPRREGAPARPALRGARAAPGAGRGARSAAARRAGGHAARLRGLAPDAACRDRGG